MSERERVAEWVSSGSAVLPDGQRPNLVSLIRALSRLCGGAAQPDAHADVLAEEVGEAEHLVFVLIDGMGISHVRQLEPDGFLRRHQRDELTSVYPSATASAITTLATGCWPSQHGVVGWWSYVPERDLALTCLPFLERFSGAPLARRGLVPTDLYPQAALLRDFTRDTCCYQFARIADSAYSRYFRGDSPGGSYEDLPDAAATIQGRLAQADGPTYTYLYFSLIDEASHTHGPAGEATLELLRRVEADLEALAGALGPSARIVVTADHGLIEVPEAGKHVLTHDDPLVALLRTPPSGEPRAPVFHVQPGELERFAQGFRARFGERFALLDLDDVEALSLYGPGKLHATARQRLGDFVAVAHDRDVILYRPGERPTSTELLVGYHGGLLPDEMLIPLILI
ncbi:MAG: alkaline phosphatase family protein [Planctomycetes bacterium]|nr:alkaline phosphatase family protein [Planctomycetota bacterium]